VDVRRPRALVVLVAAAVLAASCTGGGTDAGPTPTGGSSVTPTGSALPTRDPGEVAFERGAFRYVFGGVRADLRWEHGAGRLRVVNDTGRALDAPSLVAITSDQQQIPARMPDARPIPDGETLAFELTFPDELSYERMGMIELWFGDESWGLFSPVVAKT
jgi:hypothetical protein